MAAHLQASAHSCKILHWRKSGVSAYQAGVRLQDVPRQLERLRTCRSADAFLARRLLKSMLQLWPSQAPHAPAEKETESLVVPCVWRSHTAMVRFSGRCQKVLPCEGQRHLHECQV